jgi:GNAT superfamily N-acetyltransferase
MVVRRAVAKDVGPVSKVHVSSWQAGYRGLIPDAYLDALRPEEHARRYTFGSGGPDVPVTFVAEAERAIRGFSTVGVTATGAGRCIGELLALYVDPGFWGQGYGTALLTVARDHLAQSTAVEALVWIIKGNLRAQQFYERDGWRLDGTCRRESYGDIVVDDLRLQRALP